MRKPRLVLLLSSLAISLALISTACSKQASPSYKSSIQTALDQADLKDIRVSEDVDNNTITLTGTLHSDDAKQRATDIAKANAGNRIVVNQVSVEPVGAESEAKDIASNVDDGIENNYKAALISKGLNKQDIHFDAKNGILILKGKVKTPEVRKEAQQLAEATPNVQQVLNQIEIKR